MNISRLLTYKAWKTTWHMEVHDKFKISKYIPQPLYTYMSNNKSRYDQCSKHEYE